MGLMFEVAEGGFLDIDVKVGALFIHPSYPVDLSLDYWSRQQVHL